jgi:hypothetical protein
MTMSAAITARLLAERYAAYLHAQLLGDETETVDFGLWLDDRWCEHPLFVDEPCADDANGVGGADHAVTWIERDDEVIGVLTGPARGCYRVPLDAMPPIVALYLDDAEGCSTGSLAQERASARSLSRPVARPTEPPGAYERPTRPAIPPMPLPPVDILPDSAVGMST